MVLTPETICLDVKGADLITLGEESPESMCVAVAGIPGSEHDGVQIPEEIPTIIAPPPEPPPVIPTECTPIEEGAASPIQTLISNLIPAGITFVPAVYSSKAWVLTRDVGIVKKIMAWQDARCTRRHGWMGFRTQTNASGDGCVTAGYCPALENTRQFTIMFETVCFENANFLFHIFSHHPVGSSHGFSIGAMSGSSINWRYQEADNFTSKFQDANLAAVGIVPGTRWRGACTYNADAVGAADRMQTFVSIYSDLTDTWGPWFEIGISSFGEGSANITVPVNTDRRICIGGTRAGTAGTYFGFIKDVRIIGGIALNVAGLTAEINSPSAHHRWKLDDGTALDTGTVGGLNGTVGAFVVSCSDEEFGGRPLLSLATADGLENRASSITDSCTVTKGVMRACGGKPSLSTGEAYGMTYVGTIPGTGLPQAETIIDLQEFPPNFPTNLVMVLSRQPNGNMDLISEGGLAAILPTMATALERRIMHMRRKLVGTDTTLALRFADGVEATVTGLATVHRPSSLHIGGVRTTFHNIADINQRLYLFADGDYTDAAQDIVTAWAEQFHFASTATT